MNIDSKEYGLEIKHKGIEKWLLNMETHDAFGGLKTAVERSKKGLGTAVFCSHNLQSDMLGALLMLKKIPEFADKEFVLPISSMMYKRYWPGEKLLGITFIPVHSPEVKRKHALAKNTPKPTLRELSIMDRLTLPKDNVLDSEAMLQRYLAASKRALEHGGIVIVAPQAQGNLDKLDMTHQRKAFSKFWNYMNENLSHDYSILPIGASHPRLAQLKRPQKGVHFGEKLLLEVGTCYTREDAAQAITKDGGNADNWMYSRIASLLPSEAVKRE